MKRFFERLLQSYRRSAPTMVLLILLAAVLVPVISYFENGEFFTGTGAMVIVIWTALTVVIYTGEGFGKTAGLSAYDRNIIGKCFSTGGKGADFYAALRALLDGDYNTALNGFQEVKEYKLTDREKAVLNFYFGICYFRMGYPTNAGQYFEDAYEGGLEHPDALLMAARNYCAASSYTRSEDIYNRLIKMRIAEDIPAYPFIYNELGRLYLRQSNAEAAEKYFTMSMEKGLDTSTAQGGLALCRLCAGKKEEARYLYRSALASSMPDAEGYKEYCSEMAEAFGYPPDFFGYSQESSEEV